MDTYTILAALAGGTLIGLSAVAMLWLNGRILGVSGQLAGIIAKGVSDRAMRACFILGIVAGAALLGRLLPGALSSADHRSLPLLALAGLLVGVGTRLGGGCTSGHGVCGMARLSGRSVTATLVFMATAIVTVYFTAPVLGGIAS